MISVQADFESRSGEIDCYFRFLRAFDERRVEFLHVETEIPALDSSETEALFKTLKANGFLLLYNLMESTLKNAIEAIFDELAAKGVSFDECRHEMRQIVLKNLKQRNVDQILPSLTFISTDVIAATFDKSELFSGNVDGRRIREVAKSYGFRWPHKRADELLTVKTNRNDLAHGNKSFADVGRDYDTSRLEQIQREVVSFLQKLLENVADYLSNKDYLHREPDGPTSAPSATT